MGSTVDAAKEACTAMQALGCDFPRPVREACLAKRSQVWCQKLLSGERSDYGDFADIVVTWNRHASLAESSEEEELASEDDLNAVAEDATDKPADAEEKDEMAELEDMCLSWQSRYDEFDALRPIVISCCQDLMTALVMMETLISWYFIIPALFQMTDDNKESSIAKFQRDKPFVFLRLLV